jgi:hypothetical protein
MALTDAQIKALNLAALTDFRPSRFQPGPPSAPIDLRFTEWPWITDVMRVVTYLIARRCTKGHPAAVTAH